MTDIRITIIGAGSAEFSGGIVRDLCVAPGLRGSHVCFMDIDEHRLEMVSRLAQRLAGELRADLSFSTTTNRRAALSGADFVINTAQVGGHNWVEAQRALAEKHGYYRGAHLHNYGQIVFHLDVARDMEQVCPHAWLLQSANPVFEGCTLVHRESSVKVVGLCHGHYGYREVARTLGLELEHVSAQMPGFNHWIWMTDFRYQGQDAYPLLDRWIEQEAEAHWAKGPRSFGDNQMSRAAIHLYKLFGVMPIGDTPRMVGWWYHTDLETKKHWYGALGGFDSEIGWGQYLERQAENVLKVERAATDESTPVVSTFPPKQSDEQIVPIINSMVRDQPAIYQVNIANCGTILPGFPEDLVVECEAVVSAAGIRGTVVTELPERLMHGAMVPRWQAAELMVEAIRRGDRQMLLMGLLYDQRTRDLAQAEALLEEWLADPRNQSVAEVFR